MTSIHSLFFSLFLQMDQKYSFVYKKTPNLQLATGRAELADIDSFTPTINAKVDKNMWVG